MSQHSRILDPETGKWKAVGTDPRVERVVFPNQQLAKFAAVSELNTIAANRTKAYEKKPLVRRDARELHEDIILKEFPDDPLPMPSEHLLELVFEFASLQAKNRPSTHHTLHPSALLTTAITFNDYIVHMLTPLVKEHVKLCLDEEFNTAKQNEDASDGEGSVIDDDTSGSETDQEETAAITQQQTLDFVAKSPESPERPLRSPERPAPVPMDVTVSRDDENGEKSYREPSRTPPKEKSPPKRTPKRVAVSAAEEGSDASEDEGEDMERLITRSTPFKSPSRATRPVSPPEASKASISAPAPHIPPKPVTTSSASAPRSYSKKALLSPAAVKRLAAKQAAAVVPVAAAADVGSLSVQAILDSMQDEGIKAELERLLMLAASSIPGVSPPRPNPAPTPTPRRTPTRTPVRKPRLEQDSDDYEAEEEEGGDQEDEESNNSKPSQNLRHLNAPIVVPPQIEAPSTSRPSPDADKDLIYSYNERWPDTHSREIGELVLLDPRLSMITRNRGHRSCLAIAASGRRYGKQPLKAPRPLRPVDPLSPTFQSFEEARAALEASLASLRSSPPSPRAAAPVPLSAPSPVGQESSSTASSSAPPAPTAMDLQEEATQQPIQAAGGNEEEPTTEDDSNNEEEVGNEDDEEPEMRPPSPKRARPSDEQPPF